MWQWFKDKIRLYTVQFQLFVAGVAAYVAANQELATALSQIKDPIFGITLSLWLVLATPLTTLVLRLIPQPKVSE